MIYKITEANIETKRPFQIGTATVGDGANTNERCSHYVGKKATGRDNSCDHDGCTRAKNQARANLRLGVIEACRQYITSTTACKEYYC